MNIKDRLEAVKLQITEAEKKAGRKPGQVRLLAVSKFHSAEAVEEAFTEGQLLFGENRVQEASEKFTPLISHSPEIELHMIGQLQTNKVKKIVPLASCIQSVDRIELLKEIEKVCTKINKSINILFEMHTGEESKAGFITEKELRLAMDYIAEGNCPHIIPSGFMTMAPFTEDEKLIRSSFSSLRKLSEKLTKEYPKMPLKELSMGMSGDFKIAIEEGSTMVRIGTAIFGERDYTK